MTALFPFSSGTKSTKSIVSVDIIRNNIIDFNNDNRFDVQPTDKPWGFDTRLTLAGCPTYTSYPIGGSQITTQVINFVLTEPTNFILYYKVSSEDGYDYANVSIDDEHFIVDYSGTDKDWIISKLSFDAGEHNFTMSYQKDSSGDRGADCFSILLLE